MCTHKLQQCAPKVLSLDFKTKNLQVQYLSRYPPTGIHSIEVVNQLAKEGARSMQTEREVTFAELKTQLKTVTRQSRQRDDYHQLSRAQQVMVFRLRTGHNHLNQHMLKKLKLVTSPICPWGEAEQSAEHVLQECRLFEALFVSLLNV